MKATETTLHGILEISSQYVIPLFQRTYSWEQKQWETFWQDLCYLAADVKNNQYSHFIGSIVTLQIQTSPGEIQKFTVIDGQQRLTTAQLFLLALKKRALELGDLVFADDVNDYLQNNKKQPPHDQKLLPTVRDQEVYRQLFLGVKPNAESPLIVRAFYFFLRKLHGSSLDLRSLLIALTYRFSIVSITLGQEDDPYAVFESLNGKGLPLSVGDLLRNLLFMRVPNENQIELYERHWLPIQDRLNERLTDFFRHFCAADGVVIRESDLYFRFRETYVKNKSIDELTQLFAQLNEASVWYGRFIQPESEPNPTLRKALKRLGQLPITTHYPFLLNLYREYENENLPLNQFLECLKLLETYLIRMFLTGKSYTGLNKEFPLLFRNMLSENSDNLVDGLKTVLVKKRLPSDLQVRQNVPTEKLYGNGDRMKLTRFVLYSLEEKLSGTEVVASEAISIEHIAPQTPTDYWKEMWKESDFDEYEMLKHTLGNLTLTGNNSALSNDTFEAKKAVFTNSNFRLTRDFLKPELTLWDAQAVQARSESLIELALEVWPYFGPQNVRFDGDDYSGKKPVSLFFDGQKFDVPLQSWSSCIVTVLNYIIGKEPEKFEEILLEEFPTHFLKQDKPAKRYAQLSNGYFVNINLNSKSAVNNCRRYLEATEINHDDWAVECLEQYHHLDSDNESDDFRGKKPISVYFNGKKHELLDQTWRSLIVCVVNHIIEYDSQIFNNELVSAFPSHFTTNISNKRAFAPLSNGWYVDTNWTSNNAIKHCKRYLSKADISIDDWAVECL